MSQLFNQVLASPGLAFAAILSVLTFIGGLYWYLLPKPIPGSIPYDKVSSRRLLGDLPDLLKAIATTRDPIAFFRSRNDKLQSAIVQIWPKPFHRPIVIICDPRETEDILLRRTREFDRGYFFEDVLAGVIPYHHICLQTNEQFKAQRRLISDAMSPAFLRDIGVPRVHESALGLVELWRMKTKLAGGKPFEAFGNLKEAVFDAIWYIASGDNARSTASQLDYLTKNQGSIQVQIRNSAAVIPEVAQPAIVEAINHMTHAMQTISTSPFPQTHNKILKLFQPLRGAFTAKNKVIDAMLERSRAQFDQSENQKRESALDFFLYRDIQRAEKFGDHTDEKVVRDEVLGFLLAGHETTSTSLAWTVKYLGMYPSIQHKLRESLTTAFPDTKTPSAEQLASGNLHYLEAFIQECSRTNLTAQSTSRRALIDTEVLGHFIPKNTEIYMLFGGAGYLKPPIPVSDSVRSKRSLEAKYGEWDVNSLCEFDPERWIDENGEFNPQAGPLHVFGLGIRGCWGKKLAYIEMRIMIALLVLEFEFEAVPENLSGLEGQVRLTYEPRQSYVKLRAL